MWFWQRTPLPKPDCICIPYWKGWKTKSCTWTQIQPFTSTEMAIEILFWVIIWETSKMKQRGFQSLPLFWEEPRAMPFSYRNASACVKLRGFTLNHRNSVTLNFDGLKNLATTPGELLKSSNEKTVCEIKDPYKIIRQDGYLFTKAQSKQ